MNPPSDAVPARGDPLWSLPAIRALAPEKCESQLVAKRFAPHGLSAALLTSIAALPKMIAHENYLFQATPRASSSSR